MQHMFKAIAYKGRTTNLREHLQSKHSDIYCYKKAEACSSAQAHKNQTSIKSFCKHRFVQKKDREKLLIKCRT